MDGSSLFGSNLTLWLHLRKISQLLDPYPQLIPNKTEEVEPIKAYKWRHSHGKQKTKQKKSAKHCYFDCGSFEQGLDEEDLERLLQHHLNIVIFFLKFSSNILGMFPSCMWFHVLVYV
jgi:hypothetical protein